MKCSNCGDKLQKGRQLKRCQPCNRAYMKAWYKKTVMTRFGRKVRKEQPGVDIDRIHYLRGAVRDPQPRRK